jgi:DNA polymerase-1
MGLTPEQVIDFKGISGDTSDNLCGVKGVGDVIASKLLKEYKTLDNIYLSLDKLSENLKNKFIASKEQAFLCRSLAKIETNLFDNKNIEEFKRLNYDINKFKEFIEKYHFTGFDKYL